MNTYVPNKEWYEIKIQANMETSEIISDVLFGLNANGIIEENDLITGYIPVEISTDELKNKIKTSLNHLFVETGEESFPKIEINLIRDIDWNSEWKKNYKPLRVSDKLMIRPSWLETPDDAPPVVIEIDPEMAFGTGTHATTRLTLQLLEKYIDKNENILDVGTGTGILAIAAALIGAKKITAFDIDPIASETARKNSKLNHVPVSIEFFTGTLDAINKSPFDLIMANVNRTVILNILPLLSKMLDYQNILLLSGILKTEEHLIKHALQDNKLVINEVLAEDEWVAFSAYKST